MVLPWINAQAAGRGAGRKGKAGALRNHELLCVREEKWVLGRCLAVCAAASPTEKTPRPLKMHPQPNREAAPSLQPAWLPAVVLSDSILGLFLVFTLKKKKIYCTTHRDPRSGPSGSAPRFPPALPWVIWGGGGVAVPRLLPSRYSLWLIAVSRFTCLKGGERNLVFALSKTLY